MVREVVMRSASGIGRHEPSALPMFLVGILVVLAIFGHDGLVASASREQQAEPVSLAWNMAAVDAAPLPGVDHVLTVPNMHVPHFDATCGIDEDAANLQNRSVGGDGLYLPALLETPAVPCPDSSGVNGFLDLASIPRVQRAMLQVYLI